MALKAELKENKWIICGPATAASDSRRDSSLIKTNDQDQAKQINKTPC